MEKLEKKVKILTYYAFESTVILSLMLLFSFKKNNDVTNFDEINVKKINIIEKDGTIRMVISNKELQHSGRMNGKDADKRERPAGLLFFNDEGDECGGLIYQTKNTENGKIAGMSITMDRYKDDQVLQILNDEFIQKDKIMSQRGLFINDFPSNSNLETRNKAIQEAQKISDEKTRNEKLSQIYQSQGSKNLLFLGKTKGNSQGLFIADANGMPKMMIYVDEKGNPKIQTFNDKGEIVDFIK